MNPLYAYSDFPRLADLAEPPDREWFIEKVNSRLRNDLWYAPFRLDLIEAHHQLKMRFGITIPVLNLVAIIDIAKLFELNMPNQYLAPVNNESYGPARFIHNGERHLVIGDCQNGIDLIKSIYFKKDSLSLWDNFICMDYDEEFELQGCWQWRNWEFLEAFSGSPFVSHQQLMLGEKLFPFK